MTDSEWRMATDKRLGAIETRLRTIEKENAVDEVHRQSVEKRLGNIESMLVWLNRLVIGGLVTSAVVFAIGGGFKL